MKYVIHYYKEGRLDTRKALAKVRSRVGLQPVGRVRYLRWAAIAASVVVLVGIAAYALFVPSTVTLTAEATPQIYHLTDGTVVTLAPHSSISYTDDCRHVRLTGKAFFDIHHDSANPFTITDEENRRYCPWLVKSIESPIDHPIDYDHVFAEEQILRSSILTIPWRIKYLGYDH